jgi:hypothetical protein
MQTRYAMKRIAILSMFLLCLLSGEEGRLSGVDIMVNVVNHCIEIGKPYNKFSLVILDVVPSDKFISRLNKLGKEYVEYKDELEDDVAILKISILGKRYDGDSEINFVEISHRDSPLSGIRFEYRYFLDQSGAVDRFVYISDKGLGRY